MTKTKIFAVENFRIALKWGAVYIAMTLGWAIVGKLLGMHDSRIRYNLFFNAAVLLPSLPVYVWAIREMARNAGGSRYGSRVGYGLLLTLVVTALGPLTPIVSTMVLSPRFFDNAIRFSVDSGLLSEEEARRQFTLSSFILQGFIGGPVFGILLSLIGSLFGSPGRNGAPRSQGTSSLDAALTQGTPTPR